MIDYEDMKKMSEFIDNKQKLNDKYDDAIEDIRSACLSILDNIDNYELNLYDEELDDLIRQFWLLQERVADHSVDPIDHEEGW